MKAILRQVRISPKKANLIAGIIREKSAEEALEILKYMPKKAAVILYKLLFSAVSNATNNFKQKKEDLLISKILVTNGPIYKRGQSHSKGRVTSLFKRTSHIKIELESNFNSNQEIEEAQIKTNVKNEKSEQENNNKELSKNNNETNLEKSQKNKNLIKEDLKEEKK